MQRDVHLDVAAGSERMNLSWERGLSTVTAAQAGYKRLGRHLRYAEMGYAEMGYAEIGQGAEDLQRPLSVDQNIGPVVVGSVGFVGTVPVPALVHGNPDSGLDLSGLD